MTDSEQIIDRFISTAREFCAWLEGDPSDERTDRYTALSLLSSLYGSALRLPEVGNECLKDDHLSKGNDGLTQQVRNRLERFPLRQYWRVKKVADGDPDKVGKAEDDIARDLFLTYTAVKDSLLLLDRGETYRNRAVWSWRFTFWLDWGKHSSNAIQALHAQFHEEYNREEK